MIISQWLKRKSLKKKLKFVLWMLNLTTPSQASIVNSTTSWRSRSTTTWRDTQCTSSKKSKTCARSSLNSIKIMKVTQRRRNESVHLKIPSSVWTMNKSALNRRKATWKKRSSIGKVDQTPSNKTRSSCKTKCSKESAKTNCSSLPSPDFKTKLIRKTWCLKTKSRPFLVQLESFRVVRMESVSTVSKLS